MLIFIKLFFEEYLQLPISYYLSSYYLHVQHLSM